jgi:hypothetical protein
MTITEGNVNTSVGWAFDLLISISSHLLNTSEHLCNISVFTEEECSSCRPIHWVVGGSALIQPFKGEKRKRIKFW